MHIHTYIDTYLWTHEYINTIVHTLQGQRSCCWYLEGGEEEAVLGGEYSFSCIQMTGVEIPTYVVRT